MSSVETLDLTKSGGERSRRVLHWSDTEIAPDSSAHIYSFDNDRSPRET